VPRISVEYRNFPHDYDHTMRFSRSNVGCSNWHKSNRIFSGATDTAGVRGRKHLNSLLSFMINICLE